MIVAHVLTCEQCVVTIRPVDSGHPMRCNGKELVPTRSRTWQMATQKGTIPSPLDSPRASCDTRTVNLSLLSFGNMEKFAGGVNDTDPSCTVGTLNHCEYRRDNVPAWPAFGGVNQDGGPI